MNITQPTPLPPPNSEEENMTAVYRGGKKTEGAGVSKIIPVKIR